MNDMLKDLKTTWDRVGNTNQRFIDKETIRIATEQKSQSVSRMFSKLIRGSVALVLLNFILLIINTWGYIGNIYLLLTLTTFFLLCSVSAYILIRSLKTLLRIDRSIHDLKRNILDKIRFYRKFLSPVLHALSYLLICLTININLIVDNDGGRFEINKPWLNILIYIVAYVSVYFYYRYKFNVYLEQLRTSINDLDSNQLTNFEFEFRKQKWITILVISLVLIILITGIVILFVQ